MSKQEPRSPRSPDGVVPPSCPDLLKETATPGLVGITADTQHRTLSLAYDPARLSADDAGTLAARVHPPLQQRFDTCTLRLGPKGGRACETCALAL
jgi:Cd2+/Zn2+-exporting ATPase